jgi:SAM-dependent methyltransferase
MRPPEDLLARVEVLVGSRPVAWAPATGGYSVAERWSLDLADGRRVFAKMATKDFLAGFLRDEHRKMSMFDADFRCAVLAWEDGDQPMLVLEDLRDARWPPPWEPGDVERVHATLERIWSTPAHDLPDASRYRAMFGSGWEAVAADPAGFLSLGVASAQWLDDCLPALRDAARAAVFEGDDFLHMDVRSDNLCFARDRVVFVDWNWAVRGPRELDLGCSLPALRLEGGPYPTEVASGLGGYAAGISAFFAAQAHQPAPEGAPTVRRFQLRQLRIALPWACRELGLPLPDVRWAHGEIEALDADLEAGRIDEAAWHAGVEESLIDAYLASDDPRGQSGKSGDESVWRWSRELILDAFPGGQPGSAPLGRPATFLDVGCANGYLMESIHRWGRERGIEIEPYGLDISWRIASVAKCRLPQWADRIYVGNAIDWTPPRRFDVVQAGLDEVRPPRRRELVERLRREYVARGGVLIFRPGRVADPTYPDPAQQLEALGFRPDGIIDSVYEPTGDVRRTAFLRA